MLACHDSSHFSSSVEPEAVLNDCYVYADESIHVTGAFIVTALVFCAGDVQESVRGILESVGLRPGIDEYKSSAPKKGQLQNQLLRRRLREYLSQAGCKVALSITHISERKRIGEHAMRLITSILDRPGAQFGRCIVRVDEGIDVDQTKNGPLPTPHGRDVEIRAGADSKKTLGIQLADLCAHSAAMILKSRSGIARKIILSNDDLSYEPVIEVSLDFEIWALLRYSLSSSRIAVLPAEAKPEVPEWYLEPFGLTVSEHCLPDIRQAAHELFETVYVGCIH